MKESNGWIWIGFSCMLIWMVCLWKAWCVKIYCPAIYIELFMNNHWSVDLLLPSLPMLVLTLWLILGVIYVLARFLSTGLVARWDLQFEAIVSVFCWRKCLQHLRMISFSTFWLLTSALDSGTLLVPVLRCWIPGSDGLAELHDADLFFCLELIFRMQWTQGWSCCTLQYTSLYTPHRHSHTTFLWLLNSLLFLSSWRFEVYLREPSYLKRPHSRTHEQSKTAEIYVSRLSLKWFEWCQN